MHEGEIRVGVVGVRRGESFIKGATDAVGMKLVAICDVWEERLRAAGSTYGVATFTDYDAFLEHDLDAVILANYFHEHAPFAVKALDAGKHVLSETSANGTIAQGVELCRAAERSGCIYMLAENYCYTVFSQELRRLYRTGEIGRVTYAEGEYNHPMAPDARLRLAPGEHHWRNWLPSTYYCTHALAPLVYITESMPTMINALSIAAPEVDELSVRRSDPGLGDSVPDGRRLRVPDLRRDPAGTQQLVPRARHARGDGDRARAGLLRFGRGSRLARGNGTAGPISRWSAPTSPSGRSTGSWPSAPATAAGTSGPTTTSRRRSGRASCRSWTCTGPWR